MPTPIWEVIAMPVDEEILLELKKHTALLKSIAHQRRGISDEDKEELLSVLNTKRFLTTSEVMALLNTSRDTALKAMRQLASETDGVRFFNGGGNQPSRIVRMNAVSTPSIDSPVSR
jgi:hypothetical protein